MTELAKAEKKEIAIVDFQEFDIKLAKFQETYKDVVYELTDAKVEKQARSDKYALGTVISALDKAHKKAKAPLKQQVDLLDGERKRIKDALTVVQDRIKSQLDEHTAKQQAIEDALVARVDAIKSLVVFPAEPTSTEIMGRIRDAKRTVIDDTFKHHQEAAEAARTDVVGNLMQQYVKASQSEADAAELDRLRKESDAQKQKDRDAQIAADAIAQATQKAADDLAREKKAGELAKQKAEQDTKDAAEHAEREKQAAVAKVKADADKKERERIAAEEAERAEDARRQADESHRKSINSTVMKALVDSCNLSQANAKKVLLAIHSGSIPNVTLKY